MTRFGRVSVAIALLSCGLVAGYFIGCRTGTMSEKTTRHHSLTEGGHVDCVKFSLEGAKEIVASELRNPTLPILKSKLDRVDSIEFIELEQTSDWFYRICAYINNDERFLWRFEVDHMTGMIGSIWPEERLSRSRAIAVAEQAFQARTHPYLKANGPPMGVKINRVGGYPDDAGGGWYLQFRVEDEGDMSWSVRIDSQGSVMDVVRSGP